MTATALQGIDVTAPRRKWACYADYLPTDIQELPKIPVAWVIMSLKHALAIPITDGPHETPEKLLEGIPFVSAEAVKNGRLDFVKKWGFISLQDHERFSRKYHPQRGDVFMVKSGATTGSVARVETDETFNIWSPLAVMRPHSKRATTGLIYYFMQSEAFFYSVKLSWSYGTQQNIGMGVLSNLKIPLPPLDEQLAIAAFLDRETTRIDELIAKKQRLEELLTEKTRLLQSHTVIGSSRSQSHAASTDIPWLPSCPKGWQLLPLRRVVKWIEQGWSPSCDGREAEAGEWGVLKAGCVNSGELDESENKKLPDDIAPDLSYQIRPGDVLMSRACGTASLVGSVAFVKKCREKLLLCDKVFRLHPNTARILPEFLTEALRSKAARTQIEQSLSGADGLANNITQSTIKEIVIPVPPLTEQRQICGMIDEKRKQIHGLRVKTDSAIARLREYRSALITAAVTGQIDVRNYQKEAPCP
jgi:type I restriction enzyme S subunit